MSNCYKNSRVRSSYFKTHQQIYIHHISLVTNHDENDTNRSFCDKKRITIIFNDANLAIADPQM